MTKAYNIRKVYTGRALNDDAFKHHLFLFLYCYVMSTAKLEVLLPT